MTARVPPIQLSVHTGNDSEYIQLPPSTVPALTPPVTPTIEKDKTSASLVANPSSESLPFPTVEAKDEHGASSTIAHVSTPLEFPGDLKVQYDSEGRPIEFGRGVWSIVYMASSCVSAKSPMVTPPSSPATATQVLAVKSPVRRDARPVLQAEALILTRLSLTSGHERHAVPFHGYIPETHSIVMSAVPLALSTYIEDTAGIAQKNRSTRTMFDPVQGMASWLDLAQKLIAGLAWLHNGAHIVHGDIKPHNFLLRPRSAYGESNLDAFPYEPLFADFSSAYEFDSPSTSKSAQNSLSAMTPPFTAPELLSLSALKSPDVAPTPASDVFSLAVTLLAAATGDLLLYPGSSSMQRLAMAREGHQVLDFARCGANGSRVPRNGAVEQTIKPAILKNPAQRIVPTEWLGVIESLA